ncbi:MAG: F0F1 ATP synthase subunit gamma [Rickettsiales bacterium]|nr:F0F1 ATP synthase subunit gamma [Rickettsiales bacterium]
MPSLKSLKNRIGSVKNTRKITKAMKMVAASKLRKMQERAEDTRPYARKIQQIINNLASSMQPNELPELLKGRLDKDENQITNNILLIVTSSDRGLCGNFNGSLIKASKAKIEKLKSQGKNVKIITIGKKAKDALKSIYSRDIIFSINAMKGKYVEFSEADEIGKIVIDLFEKGEIDSAEIIYSKFINAITQQVTPKTLIPLETSEVEANDNNKDNSKSVYEYEPDEESILKTLLPKNISVQIFTSLLENSASEQGARMSAMDNATKNAGEMINKLSLQYNRTRQANITKELIEIISGAEAL